MRFPTLVGTTADQLKLWAQRLIARYEVDYQGFAGSVTLAITATGASQATAQLLIASVNEIKTTPLGSGVMLPPNGPIVQAVVIWNGGTNPLSVYPQINGQINALGSNNPFSLSAGKLGVGWYASNVQFYFGQLT